MEKIPCIKCDKELWKYIRPYLLKWGYLDKVTGNWPNYPFVVINECGCLGVCNNYSNSVIKDFNRELIYDVEEFLKRAAELKGFIYKKKGIMEINGIEIKPGMVIKTDNNEIYIAVPAEEGMALLNARTCSWKTTPPENIKIIRGVTKLKSCFTDSGKILWEKPKEVILTMDEIAKKFGYPVESIKIKK